MIRVLFFTAALWVVGSCALAQTPTVPPARAANETFFGTEVPDPYRWLEDVKSPEVAAWMKSQSDYTTSLLARIPGLQQRADIFTFFLWQMGVEGYQPTTAAK